MAGGSLVFVVEVVSLPLNTVKKCRRWSCLSVARIFSTGHISEKFLVTFELGTSEHTRLEKVLIATVNLFAAGFLTAGVEV